MAAAKKSSSKSTPARGKTSRGKTTVATIGRTVSGAATAVADGAKAIVTRTGKAMEPVSRALGMSKKPTRKTAKTTGRATSKQSTKKKTK